MANAAATVHTTFQSALERCGFTDDAGYTLIYQGIMTAEDRSLTDTIPIKLTY